jgi:hypothetical protein
MLTTGLHIVDFVISSSQSIPDVMEDINKEFRFCITEYNFKKLDNRTKIRFCVEIEECLAHHYTLGKNEIKTPNRTYDVTIYLPNEAP